MLLRFLKGIWLSWVSFGSSERNWVSLPALKSFWGWGVEGVWERDHWLPHFTESGVQTDESPLPTVYFPLVPSIRGKGACGSERLFRHVLSGFVVNHLLSLDLRWDRASGLPWCVGEKSAWPTKARKQGWSRKGKPRGRLDTGKLVSTSNPCC